MKMHFRVRSTFRNGTQTTLTLDPVEWNRDSETETIDVDGEKVPAWELVDPSTPGAEPYEPGGKTTELRFDGHYPAEGVMGYPAVKAIARAALAAPPVASTERLSEALAQLTHEAEIVERERTARTEPADDPEDPESTLLGLAIVEARFVLARLTGSADA